MAYHHYVSEFYLKHFTDPSDTRYLWRYDGSAMPKKLPPRRVGGRPDYHSFAILDGGRDTTSFELLMQTVEGPTGKILKRLERSRGTVSQLERGTLSMFIALSFLRSAVMRDHTEEALRQMTSSVGDFVRSIPGLVGETRDWFVANPDAESPIPEALRANILEEGAPVDIGSEISLRVLARVPETAEILEGMSWTFVWSSGKERFLTSNNPVCVMAEREYRPWINAMRLGDAEVTFPLHRHLALVINWAANDGQIVDPEGRLVRLINRRTVAGATEAYSSDKSPKTTELVRNDLSQAVRRVIVR